MNDNSISDHDKNDKRKRVRLTSDKTLYLQRYFEVKPRPTTSEKREIAKYLNMNFRSVQVWFQNRRAKYKKDMQDMSSNLSYGMFYNNEHIARSYASNNSLFTQRNDYMMKRPFYGENIIPSHHGVSNIPKESIDFYDPMIYKPRRLYKFHDCSGDQGINNTKKDNYYPEMRDMWYNPYVQSRFEDADSDDKRLSND
ncbi:Transcription factor [Conglomerata obtusa]